MSRPTLHLPKGQLDLFSSAPAGANRAAANPAAVTSLTAEARRQDGGQGPASVLVVLKRRRPVGSWLDPYAGLSERERAYRAVP